MTKSNQSIIEKADMTLADLASGGLLNPEQAENFIEKADMTLAGLALASGGLLNPEQAENFIRKILQAPTILCLTESESESEIDTANVVQLDEAPERIKTLRL
jgi:hypothetical protein